MIFNVGPILRLDGVLKETFIHYIHIPPVLRKVYMHTFLKTHDVWAEQMCINSTSLHIIIVYSVDICTYRQISVNTSKLIQSKEIERKLFHSKNFKVACTMSITEEQSRDTSTTHKRECTIATCTWRCKYSDIVIIVLLGLQPPLPLCMREKHIKPMTNARHGVCL